MVEMATMENIQTRDTEEVPDKVYLEAGSGGLKQFGDNPLKNIDFARAQALALAKYNENKGKKDMKKEYELKKLFLRYMIKYASKWNAMENYPKQIKQKPAWFDLALSKFNENELSSTEKKKINAVFNALWEYRDKFLPERMMGEEESNRQYGIRSPYYEQPGASMDTMPQPDVSTEEILSPREFAPAMDTTEQEIIKQPDVGNAFGVRKVIPSGESYLSGYIIPMRKSTINTTPVPKPPQGNFTMGITPHKQTGGSGSGAFSIGRSMLSGFRGGDSLQGLITQRASVASPQPVQVKPDETIAPPVARRANKLQPVINRKVSNVSVGLARFRSIELPTISKQKSPVKISKKRSGIFQGKIKTSFNLNKQSVGNMSHDIKNNVGNVVDGIKALKKQARGEFKSSDTLKSINIKNIKSKKSYGHKDLDILKKLKSETHSQISRESLECKMIPKLKEQCDKVFTRNQITNEVSKFRNEFKDISKMVPTVKGDKAKLTEVSMLGRSIAHGVDGAHVDDVRSMYKNSGMSKQMKIGTMEYDYSFITGKKKAKPLEEYYEEE
jgi:hypothetical protein